MENKPANPSSSGNFKWLNACRINCSSNFNLLDFLSAGNSNYLLIA